MRDTKDTRRIPTEKDIRDYVSGELSGSRLSDLEHMLEEDEFFRAAVEGYAGMSIVPECPDWRPEGIRVAGGLFHSLYILLAVVGMGGGLLYLAVPPRHEAKRSVKREVMIHGKRAFQPYSAPEHSGLHRGDYQMSDQRPICSETGVVSGEAISVLPIEPLPVNPLETNIENLGLISRFRTSVMSDIVRVENYHLADYRIYLADLTDIDLDDSHIPASRENGTTPGEPAQAFRYEDVMRRGLIALNRREYALAKEAFGDVLRIHPGDVNAMFYSSLAHMNLGFTEEACRGFNRVLEHPVTVFYEDAQFYRAEALKRAGKADEAAMAFRIIVDQGGYYARRALSELHQMGRYP